VRPYLLIVKYLNPFYGFITADGVIGRDSTSARCFGE
jgi:hypothetical protein